MDTAAAEFCCGLFQLDMESQLFEFIGGEGNRVQCLACPHRCVIYEGRSGRCFVRRNVAGCLVVPGQEVAALNMDPIEKKPFYHFMPGASTLSFGMEGCNLQCAFCQNWQLSQPRETAGLRRSPGTRVSAEEIVLTARSRGIKVITSTYNEPLISSEWAVEIFSQAKPLGLRTAYVSNGFASRENLEFIIPWLDAINIDLKCFTEAHYEELGGKLEPVLRTIRTLVGMGKWVEVTTLVVPGFNDSDAELQQLAGFLAGVNPDIPWHVSAYHEAFKYKARESWTPADDIIRAVEIGEAAGLHYVYSGNLHFREEKTGTRCPECGRLLIARRGFQVTRMCMDPPGICPACGTGIPGVWTDC